MRLSIAMGVFGVLLVTASAPTKAASKHDEVPKGTWKLTSGEADGKALTAAELKDGKLVFNGNGYTVTLAGRGTVTGTQKLDPHHKPKTIDITDSTGANKGKTCLGIYELTDNTFHVAFAPPGKPRPTKFATAPKSGQWMHVWTLVKK